MDSMFQAHVFLTSLETKLSRRKGQAPVRCGGAISLHPQQKGGVLIVCWRFNVPNRWCERNGGC
jgi:hypothetical protein